MLCLLNTIRSERALLCRQLQTMNLNCMLWQCGTHKASSLVLNEYGNKTVCFVFWAWDNWILTSKNQMVANRLRFLCR